ncbi:MAG: HAMP domain-containing histidine kinase [Cyclobacteriaceae bacterium]
MKQKEDSYKFVFKDDGVGLPEENVDLKNRTGSLVMSMIRSFAKKLGASIQVENNGGTKYIYRN